MSRLVKETKKRSMLKSITYRVTVTVITLMMIWFVTKDFVTGLWSSLAIEGLHSIWYYVHERIFAKVKYGYN